MHSSKRLTRTGRLVFLAILSPVFYSVPVWAQSSEEPAVQNRHTVSGGFSVGKVIGNDSAATPQIGFDYLYRLNPKWEIGVQLDFVFDKGFDELEAYSLVPI